MNENNDLWRRDEFEDHSVTIISHVYPVNEKHRQDFCPCNPDIKEIRGGFEFIHRAFDGRDVLDDVILGVN